MLEIMYTDVFRARKEKNYTKHVKKGTKAEPQPNDATCPSGHEYDIECACVDAGPAARMRPKTRANLIVVLAGLVANWLNVVQSLLEV